MGIVVLFLSALFYGLAVTFIALFVGRAVIRALDDHRMEGNSDEYRVVLPLAFRLVLPILPLGRAPAGSEMLKTYRETVAPRLWMSGYGETINVVDFVALRIVYVVIGLATAFYMAAQGHLFVGLGFGGVFALYPGVWLSARIRRRHLEILKALPNVLDLLTLSVEAGKDFLTSLRDILARRRIDALGEELLRAFQEIQLGRKRVDALRDMARRVRQPDLTGVVNAIVQAEELGVSIGHILRIQGDMLRTKRFNRAEKLANEAPVKIIIPTILFIFPAVFVILIVPISLKVMEIMR